jgi:hypothetical protein
MQSDISFQGGVADAEWAQVRVQFLRDDVIHLCRCWVRIGRGIPSRRALMLVPAPMLRLFLVLQPDPDANAGAL